MIPRSSIDAVVNGLVQGVNQINEKLMKLLKNGSDDANGSTSDDKEDSDKKEEKVNFSLIL